MRKIHIAAYLDGQTVGIGYKYIVTYGGSSWCAFREAKGLKRFLQLRRLEIDPAYTEMHDYRTLGKGRCITMQCKPRKVRAEYFWSLAELPAGVERYIGVCNGSYVDCYLLNEEDTVTEYRPNPNAKEVYIPYDYRACMALYG